MKRKLIFLFIFLVLIFILLVIFSGKNPSQKTKTIPTPTPVQNIAPTLIPKRSFDTPGSTDKLLQKVEKRTALLENDLIIRNNLISSLENRSGILYSTSTFSIQYVKSPDVFMVEIQTTDVFGAKKMATSWFFQKGLSQEGICNLPIVFYTNSKVANLLKNSTIKFSPLPEGC